ncbi:PLP-dependent aminotransferase family protein [Streptosporangium lutulentum]
MLREEMKQLRPGDRLPSSRELMRVHNVSPVTVSRALGLLAAEGRVITKPGSGAYVAPPIARAGDTADLSWQTVALGDRTVDDTGVSGLLTPPPDGVIPLTGGYLNPALRPTRALSAAASRALRHPEVWELPPLTGVSGLRRWFVQEIGGDATPSDALIVSGGQAALTHAFRALAAPGTPVLVETPTYPGALAAARAAGLRATAVPMDHDGVIPELLAEAFAVTGARVFFCQPTLHNPTGATLTLERRRQVLDIARAAGAFVIEDDYARYFTTVPTPPPMIALDAHGTVVHINSSPRSCRPACASRGSSPGVPRRRLRAVQIVESFFVARPLQETALEFVGSSSWRRHLATLGAELTVRRDTLAAALTARMPTCEIHLVPHGGLHLWVRLPPDRDEDAVVEAAWRAGALVSPGRIYHPAEPPGPWIRVTHSAAVHVAELAEGVRRLATALDAP